MMRQRFAITFVVAVFVCVAFGAGYPKQDPDDREGRSRLLEAMQTRNRQFNGYQNWPMLTPGPVDATDGNFFTCLIFDRVAWDELKAVQGPHWSPAIRVYANPKAKTAIEAKQKAFPPGSILIKEKLLDNRVVAITGMLRERDSYDHSEARNNWRYFYVDCFDEMQFGRIENCRNCHQKAAETDFAFLKYADHPGYASGP